MIAERVRIGESNFVYEADPHWAKLPAGRNWTEVVGVAAAGDRVFVLSRKEHAVFVFAADGTFLTSWGESLFTRPHGISVGPDGNVWCTDDFGHCVRKCTPEGKVLLTLGTPNQPSDTGATSIDFRTIRYPGPPFNFPTNVAFAPSGEVYISDGYGNARIHRFTPDGRLLDSWGAPGSGPGQFHVPHGIAISPDGIVYVADRENSRIQLFSPRGEFLAEWTDVVRPCQVALGRGRAYVAELGWRTGMWPGTQAPNPDASGGRVSIFTLEGKLLARWGGGAHPGDAGDFFAPHDISVDGQGNLYVCEVIASSAGGVAPAGTHTLQKFTRVGKE